MRTLLSESLTSLAPFRSSEEGHLPSIELTVCGFKPVPADLPFKFTAVPVSDTPSHTFLH